MKYRNGTFKGPRDLEIYHQSWLPDEDPAALLLLVHGMAEHSGRYGNLIDQCVPAGYAVHGFDLPGHGKSGGRRVCVERFEDYTRTLDAVFERVRGRHPRKPVYLLGHSMGGLIVAAYLLDCPHDLAGAVLCGPGIRKPDHISPLVVQVGKFFSVVLPSAGIIRLNADGMSRDPAVVKAYREDPLVHTGKITARLGAEMLRTMQRVTARAGEIRLPVLILQGGADPLVDPRGARDLCGALGSSDKTLEFYDGLYHEILNEPEHERVVGDIVAWLERRTRKAG